MHRSFLPGLLLLALLLSASACQSGRPVAAGTGEGTSTAARPGPVADSAAAAQQGYLTGFPAFREGDTLAHAVVEIPAGTSQKWMVRSSDGAFFWERHDGRRRVVEYLAYPVNYGIVPRTLAWDGDPLDVLVLGPALPRGSVWAVRPVGMLRLSDGGARDDKILAVRPGVPLGEVRDLEALRQKYPGILEILQTWFTHYKGEAGALQAQGYGSSAEARQVIREAAATFEE